ALKPLNHAGSLRLALRAFDRRSNNKQNPASPDNERARSASSSQRVPGTRDSTEGRTTSKLPRASQKKTGAKRLLTNVGLARGIRPKVEQQAKSRVPLRKKRARSASSRTWAWHAGFDERLGGGGRGGEQDGRGPRALVRARQSIAAL